MIRLGLRILLRSRAIKFRDFREVAYSKKQNVPFISEKGLTRKYHINVYAF